MPIPLEMPKAIVVRTGGITGPKGYQFVYSLDQIAESPSSPECNICRIEGRLVSEPDLDAIHSDFGIDPHLRQIRRLGNLLISLREQSILRAKGVGQADRLSSTRIPMPREGIADDRSKGGAFGTAAFYGWWIPIHVVCRGLAFYKPLVRPAGGESNKNTADEPPAGENH